MRKTSLIREDAQVLFRLYQKPRVCYCRSGAILALWRGQLRDGKLIDGGLIMQ